jgi:2-polyprenyl-3-methyl-5-hydroxy-6-metoxy-1,4-benzoquinol methylase
MKTDAAKTKEPQYQRCLDLAEEKPLATLGLMTNQVWHDDPKRLGFVLARYKFVAKMFSGMAHVLEVGCADAFGTRVVLQEVGALTASDFDPVFVNEVNARMDPRWTFRCVVHDMLRGPLAEGFDGVYAIDVLEHIPQEQEQAFVRNITRSLKPTGVCLIGTPSIQSQAYASPPSREGHVNCKDAAGLKTLMQQYYHNVFLFSMNDEVVHTGFYAMAHYLWALCCHPKPM